MKQRLMCVMIFLSVLLFPLSGFAASDDEEKMSMETFLASLDFQKGQIPLEDIVTLHIPEEFRYLSPDDTEKVLVDAWGNPPGNETLGMIVPSDASIFSSDGWAVIISYEEDGYVSDEDAESINYDELLVQMQQSSKDENKHRVKEGYPPIELVGWAQEPFYDREAHKLYWAKELKFGDSDSTTLNYNIRILGRKGVLVLNVVGGMPQLHTINSQVPMLLSMTEFNPGSKYSDFDPKMDKIAAYGIGALIAGKVASKVGLLAKFGGILVALKKLWIVIIVAVGALFKKLFGKKESTPVTVPEETSE